MEYLNKILGIEVVYENVALTHLPNFIATRYRLQLVSMNGQRAIFLYPATELEQIESAEKSILHGLQKKRESACCTGAKRIDLPPKESLLRVKNPFYSGWQTDLFAVYGRVFAGTMQRRKEIAGRDTSIGADAFTAFYLWGRT